MTSNVESNDKDWVLFRDRPEWKDVTPIPQDDGPHSVVSIAYSEKFRDVYDYLRAVIHLKEKSERALKLTECALQLNSGNYSVWQLRRDIIRHLGKSIKDELEYTEIVMHNAEKNYQVWHHRRVLVEWSQDPSQEDRVTTHFLHFDPKNYHAWQHRQWYIRTFNLYENELNLVDELIADDPRNNSAWNQRYFVLNHTTEWTNDVVLAEVQYTLTKIALLRRNESSWNYLRGIIFHAEDDSNAHKMVADFCIKLLANGETSPYLLAYIVDMYEDALKKNIEIEGLGAEKVLQIIDLLEKEVDKIRCQYWKYTRECITARIAKQQQL